MSDPLDPDMMPANAACERLGLKPRSQEWLRKSGVPILGSIKNKRGRRSPVISMDALIEATRKNQMGWTAWKKFDFECRVRGIGNPTELLYLIVLACKPDHERLRAVMYLCQDQESQMLEWLSGVTFVANRDLPYSGFEAWLGNDLCDRMEAIIPAWETICGRSMNSMKDAWKLVRDWTAEWPRDAANEGVEVYSGALLLCEMIPRTEDDRWEFKELMVRCPSYFEEFRSDLESEATSFKPAALPSFLKTVDVRRHTVTGAALPRKLYSDLSPRGVSTRLMGVPDVTTELRLIAMHDFSGRGDAAYLATKDEFASLVAGMQKRASSEGYDLPLKKLKSDLKAFNYRSNLDREKHHRRTSCGLASHPSQRAGKGEEIQAPPIPRLSEAQLKRIFAE